MHQKVIHRPEVGGVQQVRRGRFGGAKERPFRARFRQRAKQASKPARQAKGQAVAKTGKGKANKQYVNE